MARAAPLIVAFVLGLSVVAPALAMDEAGFQSALTTGQRKDLTRPQRQAAFDTLLKRRDLTSAQKAEAYWQRALFLMGDGANQLAAMADYRAAYAINPGDPRIPPALTFAQQSINEIQARLNTEVNDNLANDLYQLGRWRDAYEVWKTMIKLGNYPSEGAFIHLVDDRVFCKATSIGKIAVTPDQSYGRGPLMICTL